MITAFDRSGDLALADHDHNVRHLIDHGIEGFLIGGSTGEGPYLETGERETLVAATRTAVGDERYVMGSTAAQSTRAAIAQVAEVEAGGADAVLVLTPTSLVRGNHTAVHEFFVEVANASPLPVYLYSVPRVTGYELPVELVVSLATHPNIVGLKDSGGRPYRMQEIRNGAGPEFIQFCGASAAIAQSIAGGGFGAITASSNYLPERIDFLVASARAASTDVPEQQEAVTRITKVVESHGVVGTKAAAIMTGMRSDAVRRPLAPVTGLAVDEIRAALPSGG